MAVFRLHPAFGLILTVALALLLALGPAAPTLDRSTRNTMIVRLGGGWIAAVQPSPDGKLVAIATSLGVELRESDSLGLVRSLGERTKSALCVAFSPDGNTVASGSSDRTVHLWNTRTGELLKTLSGHTGEVRTVAFSPDDRVIATGSSDHTVRLWDAQSGAVIRTLTGHGDDVCSLAFSPSGELLATAGSFDGTVKLWRVSSGIELYTLRGHSESVLCVAFSPDGRTLASGSSDRTVRLWDVPTGAFVRTLSGQVVPETSVVSSVAFDSSGKYLAATYALRAVCAWNASTWQLESTMEVTSASTSSLAFLPGRAAAMFATAESIYSWSVPDGSLACWRLGHTDAVTSVAVSPEGLVAAASPEGTHVWRLHSSPSAAISANLAWSLPAESFNPHASVAFAPQRNAFVVTRGGRVTLRDAVTAQQLVSVAGPCGAVTSMDVSPDGRYVVTGSARGALKLWDLSTGDLACAFAGHETNVWSVAFSGDGRLLASASWDGAARVWDVGTGKLVREFPGNGSAGTLRSVALSGDGRLLATASDPSGITLWNVTTGRLQLDLITTPLCGHIAFSEDGRMLASGFSDGSVRVWRARDGKLLRTYVGHIAAVRAVAFSPDGRLLVSGSNDGTVALWDLGVRVPGVGGADARATH